MLLLLLSSTISIFTACGGIRPSDQAKSPAEATYLQGVEALEDEDYLTASERFRTVKIKYIYTQYAALAELKSADTLAAQGKYIEAIEQYRLFIQSRPNHEEVPYAYWKIADSYYQQRPSSVAILPPVYERDRGSTKDAIRALKIYIERFPNGKYEVKAQQQLLESRRTLAEHEQYVAEFYLKQNKPGAAIGRYEYLFKQYADVKDLWLEAAIKLIELYAEGDQHDKVCTLAGQVRPLVQGDMLNEIQFLTKKCTP